MNITKEIKNIQIEAEKELGFPLANAFWDFVEEDLGNDPTDFDGDPEGMEEYIADYRNVAEKWVKMLFALNLIKVKPSSNGIGEQADSRNIYRKPFERRLHLLDFVWHAKGGAKVRANWSQITAKWNKEHPYDQKNQAVLKVEYYRTRNDKDVTNNLLALQILPQVKQTLAKIIALGERHPEVHHWLEFNELEEVRREGFNVIQENDTFSFEISLGKAPNISKARVTLMKDDNTGKFKSKIEKL